MPLSVYIFICVSFSLTFDINDYYCRSISRWRNRIFVLKIILKWLENVRFSSKSLKNNFFLAVFYLNYGIQIRGLLFGD